MIGIVARDRRGKMGLCMFGGLGRDCFVPISFLGQTDLILIMPSYVPLRANLALGDTLIRLIEASPFGSPHGEVQQIKGQS